MSITAYKMIIASASHPDALTEAMTTAIAAGWQPFGQPVLMRDRVGQAVVQGAVDGAVGAIAIDNVTGLQDALDAKLGKTDTAAAATKLATARTIAGVAFDGSANIALTAAGVGALATNGTAAAATKLATPRSIAGHAFDGTADVAVVAGDVGALAVGGTAAAATKLATARTIAGHAFDGTASIVITAADVGAQAAG